MVSAAMALFPALGQHSGLLHTQTISWVACKVYLSLGWRPTREATNDADYERGWRVVQSKLHAPILEELGFQSQPSK